MLLSNGAVTYVTLVDLSPVVRLIKTPYIHFAFFGSHKGDRMRYMVRTQLRLYFCAFGPKLRSEKTQIYVETQSILGKTQLFL